MPDPLPDLPAAVTAQVLESWNRLADDFGHLGPEIEPMFAVGADLLRHGKRLRAAFAAAGWRSAGGAALAPAEVRLGAGLELFQMAALVHDDLMDGSLTRRGRPSAHRQFTQHHGRLGLLGHGDSFGDAGAVLLGDLLLVAATSELDHAVQLGTAAGIEAAHRLVQTMMAEVTVGQFLDIYAQSAPWAADPAADLDRAHRVIRAKSARYSVEHPLTIGAAMAGADRSMLADLAAVGLPIGEAFQLRDDLLGVFGDPGTTGKPAGDDLREGKRTVLVTLALTLADAADRQRLRSAVGSDDLDATEVAYLRQILERSGAVAAVEELIANLHAKAMEALAAIALPEAARATIRDLAQAAVARAY